MRTARRSRGRRGGGLAVALVASLALLAGCGDDEPKVTTVVEERTVTASTPETTPTVAPPPEVETTPTETIPPEQEQATRSCPDVTITENSGDGAFDVLVTGISCPDAANLLRSDSGLTTWDCKVVDELEGGSQRYRCVEGEQRIEFTTGV